MVAEYIFPIGGIVLLLLISCGISTNRKAIFSRILRIIFLIICQFIGGFFLLHTGIGIAIINQIDTSFTTLLHYAQVGTGFVFAPLNTLTVDHSAPAFIFSVLFPIIFMSGVLAILEWFKILPLIIWIIGIILSKISGTDRLQSYYTLASLAFGQELVPMSIKNYIAKISKERLYSLGIGSMSMVSLPILGSYAQLIGAQYVITAVVLNILGVFVIISLVNPITLSEEELKLDFLPERKPFFVNLGDYLLDGGKVIAIVAIMLIGFAALLAMFDGICSAILGISFQDILGYIFSPLAILAGVEVHDAIKVGSYMATKLLTNEFVAMLQLSNASHELSQHSKAIIDTYLISFANFSSIGIVSGSFRAVNETAGKHMAVIGIRCLLCSCLVSYLTSIIVGLLSV